MVSADHSELLLARAKPQQELPENQIVHLYKSPVKKKAEINFQGLH